MSAPTSKEERDKVEEITGFKKAMVKTMTAAWVSQSLSIVEAYHHVNCKKIYIFTESTSLFVL